MTVRNARVASGQIADANAHVLYSVPAGFVLLLKSIQAYNQTSVQADLVVGLYDLSTPVVWLPHIQMPPGSGATWSGWIAMNGGDQLYATATSQPLVYWIGGALLPYATP